MNIVADSNIPYVQEAFSAFGNVLAVSGREIRRSILSKADMLVVRSVTRVDHALLHGTPVQFVGTATIGTDHVDAEYLKNRGIGFAAAPGSNALSVAQYVMCALIKMGRVFSLDLRGKTLGIIGAGNVGSRLAPLAQAVGMQCLFNDPPLQRTGGGGFSPLAKILSVADALSLHVPLTATGPDATAHLADDDFFKAMKPGAIFINTSRGGVVREESLRERREKLAGVVLDVWDNEPEINLETLAAVDIATPHIAGYSFDGKINGVRMVYAAACSFFNIEATWAPALMELGQANIIDLRTSSDPLSEALESAYPIQDDDRRLREITRRRDRGEYFDHLRKTYRQRLEFQRHTVRLSSGQARAAQTLKELGFSLLIE
jgi:erythronate-4-phosphate dehydrogenase